MKKVLLVLIFLVLVIYGCNKKQAQEVVVYTSLDQVYSEPILRDFEKQTGIKVKILYDTEAAKTVGLVNRIIAERGYPRCDIFWNSEVIRTVILKNKGVLAPFSSSSAKDIPAQFKDKEGYWAGFAGRIRVLTYNKKLVNEKDLPRSIFDLTDERWRGRVALPNPIFGTTSAHCAALVDVLGREKAEDFFNKLKANKIIIVDGNSTSRDRVADGLVEIGFTDSDDVNIGWQERKDIGMVIPDKNGLGTFLIPNTVCLIKNCPNLKNAQRLIDYLLSRGVESRLAFCGSLQIPLREGVKHPENTPTLNDFTCMEVDYEKIAEKLEQSDKIVQQIFLR